MSTENQPRTSRLAVASLVLGILALLLFIFSISSSSIQDHFKLEKSLHQARSIGLACKLYAGDHEGNFPPNLEALVPACVPDARIFISPLNPNEPMGYIYHPGHKDTDPGNIILIEDKFAYVRGKRINVYIDQSGAIQKLP